VLFEPGSAYEYSNPGMAMLSWVVTAAIKDGRHKDVRTLLRERIMRPIGVADGEWSIGYGETHETDGLPLVANWGGVPPRTGDRVGPAGGAHMAIARASAGRGIIGPCRFRSSRTCTSTIRAKRSSLLELRRRAALWSRVRSPHAASPEYHNVLRKQGVSDCVR
jgi:CubicO group peptidase (beta-lactamase class C family)